MKKLIVVPIALVLISAISCKDFKKGYEEGKKAAEEGTEEIIEEAEEIVEEVTVESIKFQMEPKSDSEVSGEVTFTEENGSVIMTAALSGLSEGEHAIHIHQTADCSSADGKSSGGHWNPTGKPHGKWGAEEGYHKGDIGNFVADSEGNASVDFATTEWCIGCDDDTKNIVGKAVIVHQGVDDYTSQPSGAAGARVACTGIIE